MAKSFSPRVSKRQRQSIDLTKKLGRDIFKSTDERLLQGAKLTEITLADVIVRDQVRTRFDDKSIRELADNIKINGLIQPLVLHKQGSKYTLVCGERRFRAMSLLKMEKAPCFVLENKSHEELMAIQFSENSSREALHYVDKADGILNYQKATKFSERKIQSALGISKTEVHRSLLIAKLPSQIKDAAKIYDIEKYVLLEFNELQDRKFKKEIEEKILSGLIIKRSQLKTAIRKSNRVLKTGRKTKSKKTKPLISPSIIKRKTNLQLVDEI